MERCLRNGCGRDLRLCLMPPKNDASAILTHTPGQVRWTIRAGPEGKQFLAFLPASHVSARQGV
jgi:hypothetical protein